MIKTRVFYVSVIALLVLQFCAYFLAEYPNLIWEPLYRQLDWVLAFFYLLPLEVVLHFVPKSSGEKIEVGSVGMLLLILPFMFAYAILGGVVIYGFNELFLKRTNR